MTSIATHDAPPAAPPPASSRRLPPPCWSHDETVALIDSYREKWYSLRRGNLRATHWQEVADALAARCPAVSGNPTKTSVQCRHKMEKLRKRYRAEIQRFSPAWNPNSHRFSSSWVHFQRMESMEKGLSARHGDSDNRDDDDEDYFEDLYPDNDAKHHNRSPYASIGNGTGTGGGGGFRIRIPTTGTKIHKNFDESPNFSYGSTRKTIDGDSERFRDRKNGVDRIGKTKKRKREEEEDPMAEMVSAIKLLGDGFVKMERMKMEMAREVEAMRMDMELKRTEMILESQQRIMEAFAKGLSSEKNKRPK